MKKIMMVLLITVGITSCGDSTTNSSSTTTSHVTVSESDQITALGVLLAALHLRDGDVEQALADASITVQEVDAAIDAFANESLGDWGALLD